jgi:hypothetical protein
MDLDDKPHVLPVMGIWGRSRENRLGYVEGPCVEPLMGKNTPREETTARTIN